MMSAFPSKKRMPWLEQLVIALNVVAAVVNVVVLDWDGAVMSLIVAALFYGWSSARRESDWLYDVIRHAARQP